VGDRVALEPGIPCRKCSYCKGGHYNLCPNVAFMAAPHTDGAMREYVKTAADFAFKLPENMSFEDGTLVEPLSVGLYATRRGRIAPGDNVVITGAGTIGLMALQAARVYGAAKRVVIDVQPDRLEMAKRLGATHVVNPKEQDADSFIQELMPGGTDVVLEAAGAVPTIQMATRLVRKGGRIVLIGMPGVDEVPVNLLDIIVKEIDVMGMFRYHNVYGEAVRLIATGLVEVRSLHTHTYPLEKASEAIEKAHASEKGTIKVIIRP
ncbi:MAG TPA: zinc-binding dehydrogenase, partial [Chloroflexota bacterium]